MQVCEYQVYIHCNYDYVRVMYFLLRVQLSGSISIPVHILQTKMKSFYINRKMAFHIIYQCPYYSAL